MSTITERISAIGIMPVIAKLESEADCAALADALTRGGIPQMEITFRMEGAENYIRYARSYAPDMIVGAGTVTTIEQAQKAIDAGAQFIVAPGLNPQIVKFCQQAGIAVCPGVATASEVEQALGLGLKLVKFFPAEQSGGIAAIRAICGPYKGIQFMPTGGLNLDNIADYFAFDRIACCGGTYMLGKHLAAKQWDEITALCRKSVQTMLGLKLAHIGVNEPDEQAAFRDAAAFNDLLVLDAGNNGSSSVFSGKLIEVMKAPGRGANGHIGFSTPCLDRAVRYFEAMGTKFDPSTAKRDANGNLKAIYFEKEIGGFAIHLLKA